MKKVKDPVARGSIELGPAALPIVLAAAALPSPKTALAFKEVTKTRSRRFIEKLAFLCPRCVLEGYANQTELHVIDDPDKLTDEDGYSHACDCCVKPLHPDAPSYDAAAIRVLKSTAS